MTNGIGSSTSTSGYLSAFRLAGLGLQRAAQYPVATVVGVLIFAGLGRALAFASEQVGVGYPLLFVLGVVLSIGVTLALIAMMSMDADDLPSLARLAKTVMLVALGFGVMVSIPVVLFAYLLPDGVWERYMVGWLPGHVPYLFATIGATLLFGMLPAMLVAWPIRARHDTDIWPSVGYVWQRIENRRYRAVEMTILVAGAAAALNFVPLLAVLVPPVLAHTAVATFNAVRDDIVVFEE